tara:strand:+ start:3232 stop:3441 length:210 start_codon:yes stop_codon:yes gene_type:complete
MIALLTLLSIIALCVTYKIIKDIKHEGHNKQCHEDCHKEEKKLNGNKKISKNKTQGKRKPGRPKKKIKK